MYNDVLNLGRKILYVFIPSIVCMVVPVYVASFLKPFKGNVGKVFVSDGEIFNLGLKNSHKKGRLNDKAR